MCATDLPSQGPAGKVIRWAAVRTTSFFAMAAVLAANAVVGAAAPSASASSPKSPKASPGHQAEDAKLALVTTSARAVGGAAPASAGGLGGITVSNRNTNARGSVRLYDDRGALDPVGAKAFMRLAAHDADASDEACALDVRLVQLVVRAAYHFGGAEVSIVSATRRGARGKHGSGEAIDFALEGVKAAELAAWLRGTPLAGVGIYTHPKTQYVHLDVRAQSFHWIDGSPPGVSWRERRMADPKQAARDASYQASMDLPEAR